MARARLLKPEFFKDEQLSDCPFEARLLFAGLWTIADREGRLEYRPKRIKAEIFPYEEVDVEKLLQILASKFIAVYENGGVKYIQIKQFQKHQHPHPKEPKSIFPASNGQAIVLPCTDHDKPLAKPSESLILNPSILVPESLPGHSLPGVAGGISGEVVDDGKPDDGMMLAAWNAFSRWSESATKFPLGRGHNHEQFIRKLFAALEGQPPIIHGGRPVAQRLLVPVAVEYHITAGTRWGNTLAFACKCVQGTLEKWAQQGIEEMKNATPVNAADKVTAGYSAERESTRQREAAHLARLQKAAAPAAPAATVGGQS